MTAEPKYDPEPVSSEPVSSEPPEGPPPKIPQTGQLWWPVPLLIVAGVLLLLTGAVLSVRKEEPEEFDEPDE